MSVVDKTAAPASCKMDIGGYGSRLALRLAGTTWILYPSSQFSFQTAKMVFRSSLRANGSRECAPDDRLQRGIQYAAVFRFYHSRLWNTGSPGQAGR